MEWTLEYGDHISHFENLRKNGEETPLDHVPKMDFSYNWFMDAYSILSNSASENGSMPLSELKLYEKSFGIICSFSEFVHIIYAINNAHVKRRIENIKSKTGK